MEGEAMEKARHLGLMVSTSEKPECGPLKDKNAAITQDGTSRDLV